MFEIPIPEWCYLSRREAGAVVVDAEGEHAVGARGEDADCASLGSFCDAVLDGVFDHRLQDERRDLRRKEVAGDVDGALEALDESDLLDVEILLRELESLRRAVPVDGWSRRGRGA